MHFLIDPALVHVDVAGWAFLVIVGVILPVGALRPHRRLAPGTVTPTRSNIYASALATHAFFMLMAWVIMRGEKLGLLAPYRPTFPHLLIGAVALLVGLLPMLRRFRIGDSVARARVRLIAPRTPREFGLFYLVSLSAGIAEELTYRGLLFTLLAALLGSWWGSALVASALFGIVHLFQGWRSAGIAALMGLREHLVVGLTGTLFVAMVVHALHDAVTGTVIGRRAGREEAEAPPAPTPEAFVAVP